MLYMKWSYGKTALYSPHLINFSHHCPAEAELMLLVGQVNKINSYQMLQCINATFCEHYCDTSRHT